MWEPRKMEFLPIHFGIPARNVSAEDLEGLYAGPGRAHPAILDALFEQPIDIGDRRATPVLLLAQFRMQMGSDDIVADLAGTPYRLPTREECAWFAADFPSCMEYSVMADVRVVVCLGFAMWSDGAEYVMELRTDLDDQRTPALLATRKAHRFLPGKDLILLAWSGLA